MPARGQPRDQPVEGPLRRHRRRIRVLGEQLLDPAAQPADRPGRAVGLLADRPPGRLHHPRVDPAARPVAPPGRGITPVDQAPDPLRLIPAPQPLQRAQGDLMPGRRQRGMLGQLPLPQRAAPGIVLRPRRRARHGTGRDPGQHLCQVLLPPQRAGADLLGQMLKTARRQRHPAVRGEELETRIGEQVPDQHHHGRAGDIGQPHRRPVQGHHPVGLAAQADLIARRQHRQAPPAHPAGLTAGSCRLPAQPPRACTSIAGPSRPRSRSAASSPRHSIPNSTGSTATGSPAAAAPPSSGASFSEHLSQPGRQLRLSEPGMTVTGQPAQVGRVHRAELPGPLILPPDLRRTAARWPRTPPRPSRRSAGRDARRRPHRCHPPGGRNSPGRDAPSGRIPRSTAATSAARQPPTTSGSASRAISRSLIRTTRRVTDATDSSDRS